MKSSPAFQFYPDDFIGGTVGMTAAEVGAYIRLLCFAWGNGFIPSDSCALKRVAGITVSESVLSKFTDGKNPRMEEERNKQAVWRDKSRIGGLHSAAKRASTTLQPPLQPNGNHPCLQPNGNTPSPSPSPNKTSEVLPSPFPIPVSLNRKDFVKIWENWLEHLKQKRKQPTILAGEMQLKKLESMGIERAMTALKFSIEGNYQGIFEPNPRQQNTEQHKPMSKMTSAEMVSEAMR